MHEERKGKIFAIIYACSAICFKTVAYKRIQLDFYNKCNL